MCPYFRLGCNSIVRRNSVDAHVKVCIFALESKSSMSSSVDIEKDYIVICPNSILGCEYSSNRTELEKHLLTCRYNGLSRESEIEERRLLKQHVSCLL